MNGKTNFFLKKEDVGRVAEWTRCVAMGAQGAAGEGGSG